MNQFQQSEVVTVRLEIDIFLADLESDLALNKDEKYKAEWDKKYTKLKGIQHKFLQRYLNTLGKL